MEEFPIIDFSEIPGCQSPKSTSSRSMSRSTKSRISSIFSNVSKIEDDPWDLKTSSKSSKTPKTKVSTGKLVELDNSPFDWNRLKLEAQVLASEIKDDQDHDISLDSPLKKLNFDDEPRKKLFPDKENVSKTPLKEVFIDDQLEKAILLVNTSPETKPKSLEPMIETLKICEKTPLKSLKMPMSPLKTLNLKIPMNSLKAPEENKTSEKSLRMSPLQISSLNIPNASKIQTSTDSPLENFNFDDEPRKKLSFDKENKSQTPLKEVFIDDQLEKAIKTANLISFSPVERKPLQSLNKMTPSKTSMISKPQLTPSKTLMVSKPILTPSKISKPKMTPLKTSMISKPKMTPSKTLMVSKPTLTPLRTSKPPMIPLTRPKTSKIPMSPLKPLMTPSKPSMTPLKTSNLRIPLTPSRTLPTPKTSRIAMTPLKTPLTKIPEKSSSTLPRRRSSIVTPSVMNCRRSIVTPNAGPATMKPKLNTRRSILTPNSGPVKPPVQTPLNRRRSQLATPTLIKSFKT